MDDKKRMAKGIKLNASQLPLKKTGDFVLGADSRKVLSDKILDNLNNRSNAGYFSASLGSDYKAWSVSRELERPSSAAEADAQMKMIEGASAQAALQNDNYDPFYIAEPNRMQDDDPFLMRGDESSGDQLADLGAALEEASWAEPASGAVQEEVVWSDTDKASAQQATSWAPAEQPSASTEPETTYTASQQSSTMKLPQAETAQPALQHGVSGPAQAPNEPSPWGAPAFETGSPAVIKHSDSPAPSAPNTTPAVAAAPEQTASPSPWSGPVMDVQPPAEEARAIDTTVEPAQPESDPNAGWTFIDDIPASDFGDDELDTGLGPASAQLPPQDPPFMPAPQSDVPPQEPPFTPAPQLNVPPQEPPFVPATQLDVPPQEPPFMPTPELGIPPQELSLRKTFPPANSAPSDKDSQLLPAWMSDLPSAAESAEGEFSVSPLAEPQTPELVNKTESETFLNSIPNEEFMIDNDTLRNLFKSLVEPKVTPTTLKPASKKTAEQAIAAAAKILSSEVEIDLIPVEEIETAAVLELDAAANKTVAAQSGVASESGAMTDVGGGPVNITRTARGTIEVATHANGRRLIPQYNQIGILISVESSDGFGLVLTDKRDVWAMMDASGRTIQTGISGVAFDKKGNLSYSTKNGDVVTWKTDGTIDTKFRSKSVASDPSVAKVDVEPASIVSSDAVSANEPAGELKQLVQEPEQSVQESEQPVQESKEELADDQSPSNDSKAAKDQQSKPAKAAGGKAKSKPASKSKPKKKKR